jgi:predicted MFS family arabinose efflux permease
MPIAVVALAVSMFAVGTTEFVIVGLLPTIAEHLDVSISTIGLVVTAYALGIAVGSDGPIGRADQTATRPPSMCSAVAWM